MYIFVGPSMYVFEKLGYVGDDMGSVSDSQTDRNDSKRARMCVRMKSSISE